jgi:hypothetical protein
MDKRFAYKVDKILLLVVFGLAIYTPLIIGIFQEDELSSIIELRQLATFPTLPESKKEIKKFPEAFNVYYSDHFGLREQFIEAYYSLIYKLGTQYSVSGVTFGQDGWMFLGSIKPSVQKYDDPMGDAINKNLFSEKQLEDFARSIMAIKNWLNKRGIEYIYVIAPNKHTIYFEKMPAYFAKQNKESATDQLVTYLKENTDVIVVDLRQTLFDEKKNHQVYFKSDTHWNFYGANVAQFEIMKKIEKLFPEQIKPVFLTDKQFVMQTTNNGDLMQYAKTGVIVEELAKPVFNTTAACTPVNETPNATGVMTHTFICSNQKLNAVIFRDSFFNYLQPYIARHFQRSTYITDKVNFQTLQKYVALEKPDIIIDQVLERDFPYQPSEEFLLTDMIPSD